MKRLKYAEDKEIIELLKKLEIIKTLLENMMYEFKDRMQSYPKMSPVKQEQDLEEYINNIDEAFSANSWSKTRNKLFELLGDENPETRTLDATIKTFRNYKGLSESYEREKLQGKNNGLPFPQHTLLRLNTIISKTLEKVDIIFTKIKKQDSTYVATRKKYDLYELDNDYFVELLKSMRNHSEFAEYKGRINEKSIQGALNQLYELHDWCEKTINQMANMTGIDLDIPIYFSPTPNVKSTSTKGAAAYWDPNDSSINFTIGSLFHNDTDYVQQMAVHEAAHMIDKNLGAPSQSKQFNNLLYAIEFYIDAQKKYVSYEGDNNKLKEAFADLVAEWSLGPRFSNAWPKLEYDRSKSQLVNEYFTSLIDGTPFAEISEEHDEYDEDGNVRPEIQEIRNYEKKTARLKKRVK